jgi:chitin disaccharide deacetylase
VPASRANGLLGYPADARLLIINADDLGMCHAINDAIFLSLGHRIVRSTSLMIPCPWALHAIRWLHENPDIPFGVHLTVICEATNYRWRPLTPEEKVPTFLDESGDFYSLERIPEFIARAKVDELEMEFRAQIETVLVAGLKPTHLDWHCLRNGGRDDIFDLTLGLAKEYGLALRAYDQPYIDQLQLQGFPTDDYSLLDSYDVDTGEKSAQYARMLRELPAGLSEWAVHPGIGNGELQALEPDSWQVRQTDLEFVTSPQAHEIIRQEGIVLLSYKPLQDMWRRTQTRTRSERSGE